MHLLTLLWGVIPGLAITGPVLLKDIRLVDARGDHGIHDVWLENGRIAGIDPEMVSSSAEILEGEGLTLLPGLIDSHVHITQHPLGAWLEHSDTLEEARHIQYLRSYLAWGVTTILDPGITVEDAQQIRALAVEHGGPDVQILGPLLGPQDGYPSSVFPELEGLATSSQLPRRLDAYQSLSPLGVKVTMEDGHLQPIWPLFSAEMRQTIAVEAGARNLPLYLHAMDAEMTREALKMEPHALVHAPLRGGGAGLAREIARSEAYVISTLVILGGMEWMGNEEAWRRRRIRKSVPSDQLELIHDPEIMARSQEAGLDLFAPELSDWKRQQLQRWVLRSFPRRLNRALRMSGQLHRAGVPLVLGSDSGGSPFVPYLVHGPSTHMEIRLLGRVGLTPLEIIRAATLTPAEMMGLDDELGTIEVGKRADLIVVEGDPLVDLEELAHPRWVIREGDLRSPKEWLDIDTP